MEPNEKKRNRERQELKRYLSRYYLAKKRQSDLRGRITVLKNEFACLDGRDSPVVEMERSIERQIAAEAKIVKDTLWVLEWLPESAQMERSILEYRFVDCYPWKQIVRSAHLSRAACFVYYNRGLDLLLQVCEVQRILAEHRGQNSVQN